MSVKIDTTGLKTDIRKYLKTYAKNYAKEASNQITLKAKSCIEMYYNDYSPRYYIRTEDLLKNSYVSYYKSNGTTFYGGVRITSDYMSPYYSRGIMNSNYTDPIIIAQLAWHGWHGDPTGYNGKFTPIYTTPPLDILREFVYNNRLSEIVSSYAEEKAVKQKYVYLKF